MTVLRLRRQTLVRADRTAIEIAALEGGEARPVERFELDAPVAWLEIASDGDSVLVRDTNFLCVWLWRRGQGAKRLVTSDVRDPFGCGFATVDGQPVVLVARGPLLRGLGLDGETRFEIDLGVPRPFRPHAFVELPQGRLAVLGCEAGDPFDTIATVTVDRLARDPRAVHTALTKLAPVWDRAIELAIGPGPGATAVVYRNPDGEEEPDDDDDDHVGGDVVAFTGFYLRDLATGALVQRIPFAGEVGSSTMLGATERSILAFTGRGLVQIDRATAEVVELGGAAVTFDRDTGRIARLDQAGRLEVIDR